MTPPTKFLENLHIEKRLVVIFTKEYKLTELKSGKLDFTLEEFLNERLSKIRGQNKCP